MVEPGMCYGILAYWQQATASWPIVGAGTQGAAGSSCEQLATPWQMPKVTSSSLFKFISAPKLDEYYD